MLGITEEDEIMKSASELKIVRIEDGYIADVSTFKHVPDWFIQLYLLSLCWPKLVYIIFIKLRPSSSFQNYLLLQVMFVSIIWRYTCHHLFKLSLTL
jgi:hypothetical protein